MNFSKEWNKLKRLKVGKIITTVRWNDYPNKVGDRVPLKLRGNTIATGRITHVWFEVLYNLSIGFIKQDSTRNMTKERFYEMMKRWYGRKQDWKGWLSYVKILEIEIRRIVP